MIDFKLVETLEELAQLMPLFLEGYHAMNKRGQAYECDSTGFTKTLVGILGTAPKNAIMLALYDGVVVGYGAGFDDSPSYCEEKHFLMWALYIQPQHSRLLSKPMMIATEAWAFEQGYHVLKAFNNRFNGSSINFFERVLGMRKRRIEFHKQIK